MSEPRPPAHLSKAAKAWWRSTVRDYDLAEHHLKLLTAALEAWDRMNGARAMVVTDGMVVADRFGQQKAHPATAIERDSRIAFARLIRELDLDGEPAPDPRPPRRGGR